MMDQSALGAYKSIALNLFAKALFKSSPVTLYLGKDQYSLIMSYSFVKPNAPKSLFNNRLQSYL
jgi:hypothetical protein